MLRRLVVDEWTGTHMDEYQHFFTDSDILIEAPNFLRSGHFSSSLGDAIPLDTANVLQISIFILVPHHIIPFLSVFPRYNVESMSSLMLAFNNNGPGHYDAIVEHKREDKPAHSGVTKMQVDFDVNDVSAADVGCTKKKVKDTFAGVG